MADDSGDRTKFFPAIEKKHGGPMSIWFDRLAELGDAKYPEQIAYLRENHGFSQAHANALVMYVRGSASSKRFQRPADYFDSLDPTAQKTAESVFATITDAYPDLELVIAWNQPMLRANGSYVIGLSAATNYLMLNPFSKDVLTEFAGRLSEYEVLKHTFRIPNDWKVDADLLHAMVAARLAEID
jgi:uncharacterized protein